MKSVFTDEYGAFLHALISARKAAKLTQAALARRLSKPQSFVSKYERRERRLDVAEFLIVARALDADPCRIIRKISPSRHHFKKSAST